VQGYTRHQLKQDKFAEKTKEAVQWTAGHQSSLIWGIGLVLLAALVVYGYFSWQNHQNEAANAALGAGMRTLSAQVLPPGSPTKPDNKETFASTGDRAKAAQQQFKATADQFDKFPYPKAAKIARYMEGVTAMQSGDNASAEATLKGLTGSRDANVAALAKMSLATLYRATNRSSEAVKIYKDLQDHPTDTVSKVQAQLEMAEMYESSDPQQASSIYRQIQNDDPKSVAAQIAGAKLAAPK
jgi:predicted negative regulator of RcsB-dependent stress response